MISIVLLTGTGSLKVLIRQIVGQIVGQINGRNILDSAPRMTWKIAMGNTSITEVLLFYLNPRVDCQQYWCY
jgi:hypothetical protein